MSKCQFQDCNDNATRVIPALIGSSEEHFDIHVCERHFRAIEFDYEYSCEIVSVKEVKND